MATALYRAALRNAASAHKPATSHFVRFASSSAGRPPRSGARILGLLSVAVASGAAVWAYPLVFSNSSSSSSSEQEAVEIPKADLEYEKARRPPVSKEDNRDLISSQHLQVKKSWEHPGVYAWGSNAGRVAAPDSTDAVVKTPRRIPYFDGQLLRDLKLDKEFGVAVAESGDVIQWGTAFSKTSTQPVATLTGKDIVKVSISRDSIFALSSGGTVFSLPVSQADQQAGQKPRGSTWIPFWSSPSPSVSYRRVEPKGLGWFDKIIDVSSGLDHCLMLTSSGRLFSAASSTEAYPSKGQLGIAGLTWATRPKGPFYQALEISTLRGFKVKQIATGDYHSIVLDSDGRVFSFGDNSSGQLGFPVQPGSPFVDIPSLLPVNKLYSGTGLLPRVTSVAAGGATSFFTVKATKTSPESPSRASVVAETWAAGGGIYGSLGTGKWTHISAGPAKVKALSGLFEYDENKQKMTPITVARLSVGSTHASAVMNNLTHLTASGRSSQNDTNWGSDVVFWGGNESYQLGTSKRSNVNEPTYIGSLDGGAGDTVVGRRGESHRLQITPRKNGAAGRRREGSQGQRGAEGRVWDDM